MRKINPDKHFFQLKYIILFLFETKWKRKFFFWQDKTINIWIMFSLIKFLSVSMIISGHIPDLQTGNFDLLYDGHNLKNISLKNEIKISLSSLVYLSRMPYIFCMCVVSWQARRQKCIRPPAYSGVTSKMTSNSLVWFPMPADRHFSCWTIFAENDKKI